MFPESAFKTLSWQQQNKHEQRVDWIILIRIWLQLWRKSYIHQMYSWPNFWHPVTVRELAASGVGVHVVSPAESSWEQLWRFVISARPGPQAWGGDDVGGIVLSWLYHPTHTVTHIQTYTHSHPLALTHHCFSPQVLCYDDSLGSTQSPSLLAFSLLVESSTGIL